LKDIEKWNFDEFIYSDITNTIVDKYGNLILMLNEQGIRIINKQRNKVFAKKGQGPGEILFWTSLCKKNDDIAVIELYRKIQVFKDINKVYKWKRNIWREEKDCAQFISASLFLDKKWIFGGPIFLTKNTRSKESTNSILNSFYIRVLDEEGNYITKSLNIKYNKLIRNYLMYSYLVDTENFIYYIKENEMNVYKIDKKEFKYVDKIKLKKPTIYKEMPEGFYSFDVRMSHTANKTKLMFEKWKTGYSAITKAVKHGSELIIQIRTVNNRKGKFALLSYDIYSLKFKNIFFTNDLLLATDNERLYFYKNGNPKFDEEADKFCIDIKRIVR
jgi:hypothetical protein